MNAGAENSGKTDELEERSVECERVPAIPSLLSRITAEMRASVEQEATRRTSLGTISGPGGNRGEIHVVFAIPLGRIPGIARAEVHESGFVSRISRLYFILSALARPEIRIGGTETRDKSIDILFGLNDRSLSPRKTYYCTARDSGSFMVDSYRSPLLPRQFLPFIHKPSRNGIALFRFFALQSCILACIARNIAAGKHSREAQDRSRRLHGFEIELLF